MQQIRIADYSLRKEDIVKIAHEFIREKYGNLPSLGAPSLAEDKWIIPINFKYPRILFDEYSKRPKKVRYMRFDNLGEITIDANKGVIIDKPRYYDLRNDICKNLDMIQMNVQKALVKVGANMFSHLPFSEHMHTPIQDIISYLLIHDTLNIRNEIDQLTGQEKEKYLKNIDLLTDTGLVRRNEDLLIPDNALIEIEQSEDDISKKLSKALAYFFAQGYENINSIQQVLGPYLLISGYIYEQSVEYDDFISVPYSEIQLIFQRFYGQLIKYFKIPRYLIQLIDVGLIDKKIVNGEYNWLPKESILSMVKDEDELLSPIRNMFVEKAAGIV